MSNRLEQEFPEVAWRAMPPVGPGGVPPEVMRQCLERGRELHNQALRTSAWAGGAAVVRAAVSLRALIRSAAQCLVRHRHARLGRLSALRLTVALPGRFIAGCFEDPIAGATPLMLRPGEQHQHQGEQAEPGPDTVQATPADQQLPGEAAGRVEAGSLQPLVGRPHHDQREGHDRAQDQARQQRDGPAPSSHAAVASNEPATAKGACMSVARS